MKEIKLTQGKVAIVDENLFDELNKYKWHYGLGYARRNIRLENGKRKMIFMHRAIMDTPEGFETDHINGIKLDNRRENLRIVTKELNQHNSKPRKDKSNSRYKGVTFYKSKRHKTGKWTARIQVNNKRITIGYYKTEIEAAKAYNEYARSVYGDYAMLNVIGGENE